MPRTLTIAGSDSGGGAGIQADIKTFTAFGTFGMSAVTAITAQNTLGVVRTRPVAGSLVLAQIAAVRVDIGVDATKIGMLGSGAVVRAVTRAVRTGRLGPVVLDPVLASTTGQVLLDPAGLAALADLLPWVDILTPNLPEAARLLRCAECDLRTLQARRQACVDLRRMGPRHVVLKGGHVEGADAAVDIWYDGESWSEMRAPWVSSSQTHGTGCTFSAAVAAGLAQGRPLGEALLGAKAFVSWAIAHAPGLGHGTGPVQHVGWPGWGGA
jgi:hydroxymethylpyrimidine/phosphomethylpyrimidine kinase